MRPPICTICNKRFSPAADAGLVYFTESTSDREANKRFQQPGFVGHKRGHEWFCAEHYAHAFAHKHLTAAEYDNLIKEQPLLIRPYSQQWPLAFAEIAGVLQSATEGITLTIHHVGSTSVPGLGAKDIIDIDIELEETESFAAVVEALTTVGYTHVEDYGIPLRDAFKRRNPAVLHPVLDRISHHLYVCPSHSPELKRHLTFRTYLREHTWARDEYEQLKQEIATTAKQDKAIYSELKEARARAFVERILSLAEKV